MEKIQILKRFIEATGKTQTEVANRIGIDPGNFSKLLSGDKERPLNWTVYGKFYKAYGHDYPVVAGNIHLLLSREN